MKVINSKSVRKSYLLFSICMAVAVFTFILMWWSMVSAAKYEASKIEVQTEMLDRAFAMQTQTVDRVDSLYNYMTLINSDKRINNLVVQNVVSTRKMQLLNDLESTNEKTEVVINNTKFNDVYSYCQGLRIAGRDQMVIEQVAVEIADIEIGHVTKIYNSHKLTLNKSEYMSYNQASS